MSELFRIALESLPEPLLILDADLCVVFANAAARDVPGLKHDPLRAYPQARTPLAAALGGVPCETECSPHEHPEAMSLLCAYPLPDAHAALLIRDVTDRRRTAAVHADFIANVSHELRTPLTAVIGIAETLLGPAKDDPDAYARFLPVLQTQARRMTKLVSGLLGLTAGERRLHTPPTLQVDFVAVAREAADLLRLQAGAREMVITDRLGEAPMPVLGDHDDLIRVIQNLIENAIKYARFGTPIVLERLREDDRVGIAVSDTGEGIPPELLPRLTERFFRADTARTGSQALQAGGGAGLGLSLVDTVVRRHKGVFRPESTPGIGSRFSILLPETAATVYV